LNPANNTREYAVLGLPYLIIYLPGADLIDIAQSFTRRGIRAPNVSLEPNAVRRAMRDPLAFRPCCGTLGAAELKLGAAVWEILWIWGETFVRWLHVIAAIGWIGSSFYFIHLDYSLQRREGLPEQAYGEAWQVHGGGFYNMVKYLVAPARMPDKLTWFKWEAYATWISGFALIVVIYYASTSLYLIDPAVMALSPATGIAISLVAIALGWAAYDGLCRHPSVATTRCSPPSASSSSLRWPTSSPRCSARAAPSCRSAR
jgi:hypothetical protein